MSGLDALAKFPHVFTAGDQLPEITGTLQDTDITNYTITLYLDRDGSGDDVINITHTAVDAVNGKFKFSWTTTDLICGKNQIATIRITDPGGLIITPESFLIDVNPAP